jgi:uroporphyrinogen-III synthase
MTTAFDPPPPTAGPLGGAGILITRPARQSAGLAQKIAALGGRALVHPAIVILPPLDTAPLRRAHAALPDYDYAVFVSANAVEYGAPDPRTWPPSLVAFAPGPGTAEALADVGIAGARVPSASYDSEGLLALPELHAVLGKRVLVFRGENGREALGDTLRARGATVDYVGCYRRAKPQSGAAGLAEAFAADRIDAVTITSSEGLENLWDIASDTTRARWQRMPTFVPHPRITEHAREHGLIAIETAGGDAGLLAGLLQWFAEHPTHN